MSIELSQQLQPVMQAKVTPKQIAANYILQMSSVELQEAIAQELDENPARVVAHNPFRGLDVRAIQDVREAILGACDRGAGVVMISPDLDELLQLAHRVVVLFAGRIVGEVRVGEDDLDVIGQLMGGVA